MNVSQNKDENLEKARDMIQEVVKQGAKIIVLPEMFNCPYQAKNFPVYAEMQGEQTHQFLSNLAKEHEIYIVGGSIPERTVDNQIYNTCYIFDPSGNQIGKHRKTHLFDIQIKGKIAFRESDTLTPGEGVTIVDTIYGKIGVMICYDIRFPEFSRKMALMGAKAIIIPGAFNMTTGPAHWELTFRARAVDNQVFMIGTAPARQYDMGYVSYGHSIVVSPWGEVITCLDENEGILLTDVDLDLVEDVREQLPLLKHRREELY